jgi:uncharacterized delta-60 repeat protein
MRTTDLAAAGLVTLALGALGACSSFEAANPADADGGFDGPVVEGTGQGTLTLTIATKLPAQFTHGKDAEIDVQVARNGYVGGVVVKGSRLPQGMTTAELTLDANTATGRLKLTPGTTSPLGDLKDALVEASSPDGKVKATAPLQAFVRGAPGEWDTTFATNGRLSQPSPVDGMEMAIGDDGGIFVAASRPTGGTLSRFTSSGATDAAFAKQGEFRPTDAFLPVHIAARQSFVLYAHDYMFTSTGTVKVDRLGLPAGNPDVAFSGGQVSRGIEGPVAGIALHPNGRFALLGTQGSSGSWGGGILYWMTAAGTPDTKANVEAISRTSPPQDLQAGVYVSVGVTEGLIAVGGGYVIKVGVPGGGFAQQFGAGGRLVLGNDLELYDVALDAQGKILVSGREKSAGTLYLARVTPEGAIDSTFSPGSSDLPVSETTGYAGVRGAGALGIAKDGKILQAATVDQGGKKRCAIWRYLPTGKIDSSFGSGGKSILPVDDCVVRRIGIQPDGKIVLGTSVIVRVWP